jgi:hypothetical protein
MAKFRVLLYEDMAEEGKAILKEKAEIVFAQKLDESFLVERVKDIDGIVIRANGKGNSEDHGIRSPTQGRRKAWSWGRKH